MHAITEVVKLKNKKVLAELQYKIFIQTKKDANKVDKKSTNKQEKSRTDVNTNHTSLTNQKNRKKLFKLLN
jgi:hypothetical protein